MITLIRRTIGRRVIPLALTICAWAAQPAEGADISWKMNQNGVFSIGDNWVGGVAPGNGDQAIFNVGGNPYVVTFNRAVFNTKASVLQGSPIWDLGGQTYVLTGIGFPVLAVGTGDETANFTIRNGKVLMDGGLGLATATARNTLLITNGGMWQGGVVRIATHGFSSKNALTVTGAGSWLSSSSHIILGEQGSSNQIVIASGGSVTNELSFVVGSTGISNLLQVTTNGQLVSGSVSLATTRESSNNVAVVSGANARVSCDYMNVGGSGPANLLQIAGGGQVLCAIRGALGAGSASQGNQAVVTDTNSSWQIQKDLLVGYAGDSNSLFIAKGAKVSDANAYVGSSLLSLGVFPQRSSFNRAFIIDPGSTWSNKNNLMVGDGGGFNQLTISNRAIVSFGNATIGEATAADNNQALVTGTNSSLVNSAGSPGNLVVGNFGPSNQLSIVAGGMAQSVRARIGVFASSSVNLVRVSGAGSTWSGGQSIEIGVAGSGNQLVISNGATVTTLSSLIGGDGTANNTVVVTGTNSLWQCNMLKGADALTGCLLMVTNGARVVAKQVALGAAVVDHATLTVTGSATTNRLFLGAADRLGLLTLVAGTVNASRTTIRTNSTLAGNGTITGAVVNSGLVIPSGPPRVITIQGDYTQKSDGQLIATIGGRTLSTQYSQLAVSGAVKLDGFLNITPDNNFVPAVGDSYTILTAGSITGKFATVNGLVPGRGLKYQVKYNAKSVVLTVVATPQADSDSLPPAVSDGTPLISGINVTAGQLGFSFPTIAGQRYVVEFTDSLTAPTWQVLKVFTADGTGAEITEPASAPRRYYRVRRD